MEKSELRKALNDLGFPKTHQDLIIDLVPEMTGNEETIGAVTELLNAKRQLSELKTTLSGIVGVAPEKKTLPLPSEKKTRKARTPKPVLGRKMEPITEPSTDLGALDLLTL